MKEEILSRLERIDHKEYSNGFEFADSSTFDEMARCFEERKIMSKEIERLKEEYMILQNASDEVEEEKDKEIERLNNIIKEAINYIDDNTYYKDHKGHINIDDLYIILQGSDKE